MKEKRKRDAEFIKKHHLLKRLAGQRTPGEAALGKADATIALRAHASASAASGGRGDGPAGAGTGAAAGSDDDGSGSDGDDGGDGNAVLAALLAPKVVVHKQRMKGKKRERPTNFKDEAHFISMEPERMATEVGACGRVLSVCLFACVFVFVCLFVCLLCVCACLFVCLFVC